MSLRFYIVFTCIMILFSASVIAADESAQPQPEIQKITLPTIIAPNEVRNYNVDVAMKGKVSNAESKEFVDLDIGYSLKIQHKYGRRDGDGLTPMEISVTDTKATSAGQALTVATSLFPKLTLLLDRNYRISSMFGLEGTYYAKSMPGINYANMIMLFSIPDADKPHAVGDTWKSKVQLPSLSSSFDFTNTIKSVETVDNGKTVIFHQDIKWSPQQIENGMIANARASVDSTFSMDNGKLLKSHSDCEVVFDDASKNTVSPWQDPNASRANIKIDISLTK